jgi:hypothetical protein
LQKDKFRTVFFLYVPDTGRPRQPFIGEDTSEPQSRVYTKYFWSDSLL